jgi:hypothetical protein
MFLYATATSGSTINWYRNNVLVRDVNNNPITTTQLQIGDPGNYKFIATIGGCSSESGTTTVNDVTIAQQTYSGGGTFCEWQAGGVPVTLNGAESGVKYYLRVGGTDYFEYTSVSTAAYTWSNVRLEGVIQVVAKKTVGGMTCERYMVPTPTTVTINKVVFQPSIYTVGGNGTYCIGEGGAIVTLEDSDANPNPGVLYRLRFFGTPVATLPGTGNELRFPPQTATGTYTVTAEYVGVACSFSNPTLMNGSVTIAPGTFPTVYNVTVQHYCKDAVDGRVFLSGSQSGFKYQLYKNGTLYGDPLTGTGGALTWTNTSAGGPYSVIATNPAYPQCPRVMSGLVSVQRLQPKAFSVSGGGTACGASTSTVSLLSSETGVNYQLWLNGTVLQQAAKPGTNGVQLNWTGISTSGKYTITASNSLGCNEPMIGSTQVEPGPTVTIKAIKYPCTVYLNADITQLNNCGVTSFLWTFGDGQTATTPEVFHTYAAGNFTASVQVVSNCGGVTCTATATKPLTIVAPAAYTYSQTTIQVKSDQRLKILNSSASTLADGWVLPYEESALSGMNPFLSGERGIWRQEGEYVYKAQREQSPTISIATDGTFTMDYFNWQQASVNAIPSWIKANTITNYSAYSFELENKDVLNVYSAALYDYNGQLISAEGTNMRNHEMAFTSFETTSGNMTGNFTIGTQATQTYLTVPVIDGFSHMATVPLALSSLTSVTVADVNAFRREPLVSYGRGVTSNTIKNNPIVCKVAYNPNPAYSSIVFDGAPLLGSWSGNIVLRTPVTPTITATTSPTKAHTGARSLMITNLQNIPQPQFKLDQGKTYYVSAWVTVPTPDATLATYPSTIAIDVVVKNAGGTPVATTVIPLRGPIVDGWQQVNGTFTVGIPDSKIDINFRAGTSGAIAYFDDLRLHPNNGVMKSYVYDLKDFRLTSILDDQNYASFFYYDDEGNVYLVKKETERGRKTISENVTHLKN